MLISFLGASYPTPTAYLQTAEGLIPIITVSENQAGEPFASAFQGSLKRTRSKELTPHKTKRLPQVLPLVFLIIFVSSLQPEDTMTNENASEHSHDAENETSSQRKNLVSRLTGIRLIKNYQVTFRIRTNQRAYRMSILR